MVKLTVTETKANLKAVEPEVVTMKATPVISEKDYEKLTNKPQINGVTLEGNKTLAELGLEIDTELDEESNNPIANSAVSAAGARLTQNIENVNDRVTGNMADIEELQRSKQDALNFDSAPTEESTNPVTSGGVYEALEAVISQIPDPQVNADWNAQSGAAKILNKPTIPEAPVNADWNANSGLAQILNKPTIPAAQVNADWNATSGVAQILNKPSIPDSTSDLTNDSGYVTAAEAANAAPVQSVNGQTGAVSLGASDVGALPDNTAIPTKTSELTNDSDYITETAVDTKLEDKADSAGASADYAAKLTASIPYGQVDATSTATVFTATVPGITELRDGVCVLLKNGVITSASGFTLNVNGLGAKPVYSNLAAATRETTLFNEAYTMLFIYDEDRVADGCWILYRGYDANTNTIGYQLRTNSSRWVMANNMYRYRLMFESADGTQMVSANASTSTNATSARTPTTIPINPFGLIIYYGYSTAITAGSMPAAAYMWQQYVVTIGYSFTPVAMTAWRPVYLKCTPQADGSAVIDPTTPYTQALPTSEDGFIYIYLGQAISETQFELNVNHTVYYYKDGGIKRWNG